MARLVLADDDLEALIAARLPTDLDMARPPGRKRFAQWLAFTEHGRSSSPVP